MTGTHESKSQQSVDGRSGDRAAQTDLAAERRRIRRAALWSLPFCTLAFAGGYFILTRAFSFPVPLADRIAFVLQADVLVALWVVIALAMVSHGKRHSVADIAGAAYAPPSPRIAVQIAFLQNTLEQAFTAVAAHLALATLLSGPALALIVIAVFLFAVGRVTFIAGYRHEAGGRAFGMITTALPTIAGFAVAIVLMVIRLT